LNFLSLIGLKGVKLYPTVKGSSLLYSPRVGLQYLIGFHITALVSSVPGENIVYKGISMERVNFEARLVMGDIYSIFDFIHKYI
jgi:hypothetical protein